jgi:hypothetical protein
MDAVDEASLPTELAAELESRFFWWEPLGLQPLTDARILAQAMNFASFHDVRHHEKTLGGYRLAEAMLRAEPGWISERSWEFWRGRLTLATGRTIPDAPPRRTWLYFRRRHAEILAAGPRSIGSRNSGV